MTYPVVCSLSLKNPTMAAELGLVGENGEIDEDHEDVFAMIAGVAAVESRDLKEAYKRSDWPKWEEAINKELTSL